jgi:TonB-dependent SusC/RagA subfamily outer membrane receptor
MYRLYSPHAKEKPMLQKSALFGASLVLLLLTFSGCKSSEQLRTNEQDMLQTKSDARDQEQVFNHLSQAQIAQKPHANLAKLLQGQFANLDIYEDQNKVRITFQGVKTTLGKNEPLFVLDGVPLHFDRDLALSLTSEDIEHIELVQDLASASLYGANGANGVILITTKKAKDKKLHLTYNGAGSLGKAEHLLPTLNATQYKDIRKKIGLSDVPSTENAETNWQQELFAPAFGTNHVIGLGSKGRTTLFQASMRYQGQQEAMIETGWQSLMSQFSFQHEGLNEHLKLGINLIGSNTDYETALHSRTDDLSLLDNALSMHPTQPVTNADGSFFEFSSYIRNPIALQRNKRNTAQTLQRWGSAFSEVKITQGLMARYDFGMSQNNMRYTIKAPLNTLPDYVAEIKELSSSYLNQMMVSFKPSLGESHRLHLST